MTKAIPILFLSLLAGIACGQESTPAVAAKSEDSPSELGQARLGFSIRKPDDTTTTQLPSLPAGIGFVVTEIEKNGPADKAGIRKLDLFWKMNDQWIVNEGQLATLLRIAVPGDKVTISVFREGKSLDMKLILGDGAHDGGAVVKKMLSDSVIRKEDGPLTIVNIEQKSAHVSNEQGTAEVVRSQDGDSLRIVTHEGEVIYEGIIRGRPELSLVPSGWKREVCALRRGLDHASSAQPVPLRQVRPRIVPPAKKN